MRTVWEVNGNHKLLLIFSGWAMDERPTSMLQLSGYDKCTCFDYTNLEGLDIDKLGIYKEITLIAWSTGVWAAEQVLGNSHLKFNQAIAVNGTPNTVHDETGIPRALFQAPYDALSETSMNKFTRRMTGSSEVASKFVTLEPLRGIESKKNELEEILKVDFDKIASSPISWTKALIGTDDAIFPVINQKNYWKEKTRIIEKKLPHYPFLDINITELLFL